MIKRVLKGLLGLVVLLVLGLLGGFLWAKQASAARLTARFETHRVDFPIPFPLSELELDELRTQRGTGIQPAAAGGGVRVDPLAGVDLGAIALERAVARGKHLVSARYACTECHGKDFGGGTMIDAPPIGRIFGVNLTSGRGGLAPSYSAGDWDRIVRHGVLPDGRPAAMPSTDFFAMSDRELSDIISYIRSQPPVDRELARPTLGPVGTVLMATGKLQLSAQELSNHQKPHPAEPPETAPTSEFGKHLVQVCTGCHGANLGGGPIAGGDPSWPPAANLTPHSDGLGSWTYEDFVQAMRQAKRKDGTPLRPPMNAMVGYAANITETEFQAMWAYLRTVSPQPSAH